MLPNAYAHQTYTVEFEIGDADGMSLQPDLITGDTKDPQGLYKVKVDKLGLIDPDYLVQGAAEKRGARGNRWVSWLWVTSDPGDVDASVEVCDVLDDIVELQMPVESLAGETRRFRSTGFLVPQGSVIRIVGLKNVKLRMHIMVLTDAGMLALASSGSGGGDTDAQNIGSGDGLFTTKTGSMLDFKSLAAGTGIAITPTPDSLVLSSTGGGAGVQTYGVAFPIIEGVTSAPLFSGNLDTTLQVRGNVDSIRNFDLGYQNCLWDIEVIQGGAPISLFAGQQFTSQADLITFLNATVPSSAGAFTATVIARPYDVVSGDAPVWKIFGKNQTLARMRGRYWGSHRYYDRAPTGQVDQMLDALWTQCFGSSFGVPVGSWFASERACFWMNANWRRQYAISRTLGVEMNAGANGRFARQGASTVSAPGSFYSESGDRKYAAIDKDGNFVGVYDPYSVDRDLWDGFRLGHSFVIGTPVVGAGGARALYIKPIGVDQFFSNYFDTSSFVLEAVGSWKHDAHRRLRALTPEGVADHTQDLVGPFSIDQWFPAGSPNLSNKSGSASIQPGPIGFQLRDLASGVVSPVTAGEVHWMFRKKWRPLAALVENRVS